MPKTEKTPPGPVCALLRATADRLGLDDARAAAYLGVNKGTYLKWLKGERAPSAAAVRLLEVLGVLEALAPAVHSALLPPAGRRA